MFSAMCVLSITFFLYKKKIFFLYKKKIFFLYKKKVILNTHIAENIGVRGLPERDI